MENTQTKIIGIPRTLIHHIDNFRWERFFELAGFQTVFSSGSSHALLQSGYKYVVNDQCFPVKLYYGHVVELAAKADYIFIPQYTSLQNLKFGCPKIIGLPQLIRLTIPGLPPVISLEIDFNNEKSLLKNVLKLLAELKINKAKQAPALSFFETYKTTNAFGSSPEYQDEKVIQENTIGIISHRYTIADRLLNFDILKKVRQFGFKTLKITDIKFDSLPAHRPFNCREVHWDFGSEILYKLEMLTQNPKIAGIMYLTYFGCGIDAFLIEIFQKSISAKKPLLVLSLDEHTGEAGFNTRIEAFIDMIKLMDFNSKR